MQLYAYCTSCAKYPYDTDGHKLQRVGEGYRVISISQGKENTVPCTTCNGTGIKHIKEVIFNQSTEQWE